MKNIRKIISIILIASISNALENGCTMSELDAKMKPLAHGLLVKDQPAMDKMCKTLPGKIAQAKSFAKKCMKGQTKMSLSLSIQTVDNMMVKSICKNKNNEKQTFLASGKCANSNDKTKINCYNQAISQMTEVANVTEAKNKFPLICCSFLRWKDCLVKVYEEIGAPVCTTDTIKNINNFLYKLSMGSLKTFCGDYNQLDKCNKFNDFLTSSQSNKVKYSTFFPALIDVFETL